MRITIVKTQAIFGAFVFLAIAAIAGIAAYTHNELRIGSTAYDRIIAGKDLVADILPPPEYIIEAYLEATIATRTGMDDRLEKKFAQLHRDFDERRSYWAAADLPQALKSALVDTAARPAQAFFTELEKSFLPALARGDKIAAARSYDKLSEAYIAQRAAVDQLVELANTFAADAEKQAKARSETLMAAAMSLVLLIVAGLAIATWIVKRRVADPVRLIAEQMSEMSAGAPAKSLGFDDRRDEIGDMARAIRIFDAAAVEKREVEARDLANREQVRAERLAREAEKEEASAQAQNVIRTIAMGLGRLSDGDLLHQIESRFEGESDQLRSDFNSSIGKLREVILAVVHNAQSIRSGSGEISAAADDLSRRTDNQAASLEETAAALSQITQTVKRTADGAAHARDVVAQTKKDADLGGVVARQAVDAMNGIEKASQQISQIIGVIDEIAFQTNLLALNAGVEAARAGDSGRGFAVVAQEVRALAQRSAEAAKEIKGLITSSQSQVEAGVTLVSETGSALARIVEEVKELTDIVISISASAQEQSTGLQEISSAVNEMDQVTQQNAAMVQESTAASHELARQADDLAALVGRFSIGQSVGIARSAPRRAEPPKPAAVERAPAPKPRPKKVANGGPVVSAASSAADWDEF